MSELKEGHYVYTDLGIERVHWCIVNGEKELVTPKGYILGDVPSYNQEARTIKENLILTLKNAELRKLLHENRQKMFEAEKNYGFDDSIIDILTPQMDKIDKLLGDKTDE